MPIYDYKCSKCDSIIEKIVKFSHKDKKIECSKCDTELKKIKKISGTTFRLKGRFH